MGSRQGGNYRRGTYIKSYIKGVEENRITYRNSNIFYIIEHIIIN